MIKSKFKLLGILILIATSAEAQSGYLGSLNGIGINVNLVPARFRTAKVEINTSGDSVRNSPLRYAEPSFTLSYTRVVSRKIELGLSYNYTSMYTFTEQASYIYENGWGSNQYRILEDIKAKQHTYNFNFNYYRKGSLAPTGKFIGFAISAGFMSTDEKEITPIKLGSTAGVNSFWTKSNKLGSVLPPQSVTNTSGRYVSLRGVIGRNFPIGNNLMINCFASFPILSTYKNNRRTNRGLNYYLDSDYSPRIKDDDFGEVVNLTMHLYNRAILSMGIKYHF